MEYLSIQEYSEKYNLSESTVRRWIKDGKIQFKQQGKQYRIMEGDPDKPVSTKLADIQEKADIKEAEVRLLKAEKDEMVLKGEIKQGKDLQAALNSLSAQQEGNEQRAVNLKVWEKQLTKKESYLNEKAEKQAEITKTNDKNKLYLDNKEKELNEREAKLEAGILTLNDREARITEAETEANEKREAADKYYREKREAADKYYREKTDKIDKEYQDHKLKITAKETEVFELSKKLIKLATDFEVNAGRHNNQRAKRIFEMFGIESD